MTAAVIVGAAAVTILVLTAAYLLIPTFGARHRKPFHVQARALAVARARRYAKAIGGFLYRLLRALADDFGTDKLSDEDAATELWVDGLAVRRELGPQAPARRPQVLTVARVRTAAIIRALPLESVPWLKHGAGFSDETGAFKALTREADQ